MPGFYTSNFDELLLRRTFGTTVEVFDLLEVAECAKNIPAELADDAMRTLRQSARKVNAVSEEELRLAGRMFAGFRETIRKYDLSACAVRCWPECSDCMGVAPTR